ncbi:MAG: hypothetical protein ACK4OI_21445, partial [Rhizobium oryzihabitans]
RRIGQHGLKCLDDFLLLNLDMTRVYQRQMLVRPARQLSESGIAVSDKALDIRWFEETSEILPENIVYRIDLNFVNRVHKSDLCESNEDLVSAICVGYDAEPPSFIATFCR